MKNDFNDIELAYATKEVAELVKIAKPTVRKYAQLLEENGYEFIKNGDRRVFVDADLRAMEAMKSSDKIEHAAKEIAEKQKEKLRRKSDIESDINNAIQSISPGDTGSLELKKQDDIAQMKKQYDQLVGMFKSMAIEYASSREKLDTIEENQAKIISAFEDIKGMYKEERRERELLKEKLDIAVDYIQKEEKKEQESKEEKVNKSPKIGLLKRLFG
ncbi:hypothetical protein ACOJQI_22850 (plasmid) [Bacillus salacetis]|uniref:hypothetical protein n=1 Tax=Bacillus salacetis TaxID=2315464 RepID=UPI003BA1048E